MRGQLPAAIAALFQPSQPMMYDLSLSVASLWEIGIKTKLGKLNIPVPIEMLGDLARQMGLKVLPVTEEHAITDLDVLPPTSDPFDRLLLAVAQAERLKFVTLDHSLIGHPLALKV